MKTIAFLNEKGGTAKTTSVFNIATVLVKMHKTVLMIDSDAQGSLTLATGNDPVALNGLAEVYSGMPVSKCIYPLEKINGLFLLPSSMRLVKTELRLMGEIGRERKLAKLLKAVGDYDYVLIDCAPALGLLAINALSASDFLVAPTETSALSTYALADLMDTVSEIKEQINPNLKFLGVIATRYARVASLARQELDDLSKDYNVLGVIKESTAARTGLSQGLPAVVAAKRSDVTKAYVETTYKILEAIGDEQ